LNALQKNGQNPPQADSVPTKKSYGKSTTFPHSLLGERRALIPFWKSFKDIVIQLILTSPEPFLTRKMPVG